VPDQNSLSPSLSATFQGWFSPEWLPSWRPTRPAAEPPRPVTTQLALANQLTIERSWFILRRGVRS
jgi:hypothetical protein